MYRDNNTDFSAYATWSLGFPDPTLSTTVPEITDFRWFKALVRLNDLAL